MSQPEILINMLIYPSERGGCWLVREAETPHRLHLRHLGHHARHSPTVKSGWLRSNTALKPNIPVIIDQQLTLGVRHCAV
jgi:hypothetical protein